MEDLVRPLHDVLDLVCVGKGIGRTLGEWRIIQGMYRNEKTLWAWTPEHWDESLSTCGRHERATLAAAAYFIGEVDALCLMRHGVNAPLLAERACTKEAVDEASAQVARVAAGWGYALDNARAGSLRLTVSRALLVARSAVLDGIEEEHLLRLADESNKRNRNLTLFLWRALGEIGLVGSESYPGRVSASTYSDNPPEISEDVPETWARWCLEWFTRSRLKSRRKCFYALLQTGRWAAAECEEAIEPANWDAEIASRWSAAVERMTVGQYRTPGKPRGKAATEPGKPLMPQARSHLLGVLRRFFWDLQEWGLIPALFNPDRCMRQPPSTRQLMGPDPRPVDLSIWAKLVQAALDLEDEDLPPSHGYPIDLVRAVAAVWVCAALRPDEISRLRVGCTRPQRTDAKVSPTGETLEKGSVCFLNVPINKTSGAYTKPLPPVVGERVTQWERARPSEQGRALDEKTGEFVDFLFSHRGKRISVGYVTKSLIPILCRRANVDQYDTFGKITAHRARATIVSQLRNGPDPWSATDIQTFLGHSDPRATQYYIKADPTRLAKRFADSGYIEQNLATVEVLLDVEAVAGGKGPGAMYYDLGHGLCANPYWEHCDYRFGCVKCPMYIAGEGANLIRAKEGIQRMLRLVALTDDERRAAEGDVQALDALIDKGGDIPLPPGYQEIGLPTRRPNSGSDGEHGNDNGPSGEQAS